MELNWLGEGSEEFHLELKPYLNIHLDIRDWGDDFSILTQKNINYAIIRLRKENVGFYQACSKSCINLNKKLIVLTDTTPPSSSMMKKDNIIHINTLERDVILKLSQVLFEFAHETSINKKITNLTKEKQSDYESGTRIDIYKVISFIDDNLDKSISEQDVAKLCHYSVPYFSKLFHQAVGVSFQGYVTNKRINKAKALLSRYRDEKIASIAYQCGYNDVSYFSRIFKKKTGLTPGEYRRTA